MADAVRRNGVKNLIPIEVGISETLSIMIGKGYRILDPLALSNEQMPFIHEGIGRYAVVRLSEDGETEVVVLLTKVEESGVESCPYVLDTSLDQLKRFLIS